MTSDGRLPPDQRRNYKNVFNAVSRIYSEEGLFALWRGCIPTIGRKLFLKLLLKHSPFLGAMVVNAAQLATYSQAKQIILSTKYVEGNLDRTFQLLIPPFKRAFYVTFMHQ